MLSSGSITSENSKNPVAKKVDVRIAVSSVLKRYPTIMPVSMKNVTARRQMKSVMKSEVSICDEKNSVATIKITNNCADNSKLLVANVAVKNMVSVVGVRKFLNATGEFLSKSMRIGVNSNAVYMITSAINVGKR